MKRINGVRTLILLTFILSSFYGCTSTTPPVQDESSQAEGISMVPQDESLNATELIDEDSLPMPPLDLKSPESTTTLGSSGTSEQVETGLVEIPGFRVQLFVTNEEFDARMAEEEALLQFDESVYLTFDSPNYKIRVGDCKTRAEATELRQKAAKLGYRDPWVVQCKIFTLSR